jgi:hypothetical protein
MNQQLADYIQQARANGMDDDQIMGELFRVGWKESEIEEALQGLGLLVDLPSTIGSEENPSSIMKTVILIILLIILAGAGIFGFYELDKYFSWGIITEEVSQQQNQENNGKENEAVEAEKKYKTEAIKDIFVDHPVGWTESQDPEAINGMIAAYSDGQVPYPSMEYINKGMRSTLNDYKTKMEEYSSSSGMVLDKSEIITNSKGEDIYITSFGFLDKEIQHRTYTANIVCNGSVYPVSFDFQDKDADSDINKKIFEDVSNSLYCRTVEKADLAETALLCDKMIDKNNKNLCLAIISGDASGCKTDDCYATMALLKKDPALCKKMNASDAYTRLSCEAQAAMDPSKCQTLMLSSLCYYQNSLLSENINECKNSYWPELCYAVIAENPALCEKVPENYKIPIVKTNFKDDCYYKIAALKGNPLICDSVKDQGKKDACQRVAGKDTFGLECSKGDEKLCLFISLLKDDPFICESVALQKKDECYNNLVLFRSGASSFKTYFIGLEEPMPSLSASTE